MRKLRFTLYASAAILVSAVSSAEAIDLFVPADLAAKRAGTVVLPTPQPVNMIYTPITPCRLHRVDLTTDQITSLQISGICGVPAYAKAVALSLTAIPNTTGYLTAYPTGAEQPIVAVLNYRAGMPNTASGIIPLNSAGKMSTYSSGAAKVYFDVTGYYAPQLWAYVSPTGTLIDSSGRVTAVTRNGIGSYTVTFDRAVDSCTAVASGDLAPKITSAYTSGNNVNVHIAALQLLPEDYYFNLMVKC